MWLLERKYVNSNSSLQPRHKRGKFATPSYPFYLFHSAKDMRVRIFNKVCMCGLFSDWFKFFPGCRRRPCNVLPLFARYLPHFCEIKFVIVHVWLRAVLSTYYWILTWNDRNSVRINVIFQFSHLQLMCNLINCLR